MMTINFLFITEEEIESSRHKQKQSETEYNGDQIALCK